MKARLRWLGTGLAVAGSVGFALYVASTLQFSDLARYLSPRGLVALAGSVLLYSLIVPLAALAWRILLAELGQQAPWHRLNTILLATQAGKYLPGNVGQHLGRVALSLFFGLPTALVIASMAYEFVLLLIADVLTAVAASALSAPGLKLIPGESGLAMAGVVAAAVAALVAMPWLSKGLGRLIRRWVPEARLADAALPTPRAGAIARVIAIYVAAMLCVGASISVLALGLPGGHRVDFALLTAAFTIAWAVGFVTPGAPAGIGVREALLLLILGPTLGAATASVLILALRVATTLGDLLCFGIGAALLAQARRIARVPPTGQS